MNDEPMTARPTRRPLRRATAFVAAAAALSGGCYQSVSAGLGGGRVNGDKGATTRVPSPRVERTTSARPGLASGSFH
jgi:nitrous oxide reductase